MFAIIESPFGKAVSLQIELKEMKKHYKAICGSHNSPSGVLFYINRCKAYEIIYLLDAYHIRYAVTSNGFLRQEGDHIILDHPYGVTENDDVSWIDGFYYDSTKQIYDNEIIKRMVNE